MQARKIYINILEESVEQVAQTRFYCSKDYNFTI